MICLICNREIKIKGFGSHLRHSHLKTVKEYYDTYLKQPNEGICICGKETAFYGIYGYAKHCSAKCSMNDEKTTEKRISTNIKKYGVANPYQSESVKNKIKNTWLTNYGVDNPNKTKEVRDKIKQTCLERYGAAVPMQNKSIQQKSKQTCFNRFGCEYPNQNSDIMKKVVDSKQKLKESIEKELNCTWVQNLTDKYGSGWFASNLGREIVFEKSGFLFVLNSNIDKIELYIDCNGSYVEYVVYNYLTKHKIDFDHHNRDLIHPYELDFYLPKYNIAIECNGYYHKVNCYTNRDQDTYHNMKSNMCSSIDIKLVNVNEDNLLNIDSILQIERS